MSRTTLIATPRSNRFFLSAFAVLVLLGAPAAGHAALIAQSWEFGTDPGRYDNTPAPGDFDIAVQNGSYQFVADALRFDINNRNNHYAIANIADLAGSHFAVTTDVTVQDGGSQGRFGLAVLDPNEDTALSLQVFSEDKIIGLRDGVNGGYLAQAGSSTQDWNGLSHPDGNGATFALNGTGLYSPSGDLNLTFSVSVSEGGAIKDSLSLAHTITAAELSSNGWVDDYAGLAGRAYNSGSLRYDYHNFAVAPVPEPTSLMLWGFGATVLLAHRRRRCR